ncbi:mucin-associated surface protein (MASP) [Trypanosoma cruzi]|nr:mucin-associated surface protein (MASP) [Trypanosoma cruzi]
MAMMMTGRVLLVCALCVLWCGAGGVYARDLDNRALGGCMASGVLGMNASYEPNGCNEYMPTPPLRSALPIPAIQAEDGQVRDTPSGPGSGGGGGDKGARDPAGGGDGHAASGPVAGPTADPPAGVLDPTGPGGNDDSSGATGLPGAAVSSVGPSSLPGPANSNAASVGLPAGSENSNTGCGEVSDCGSQGNLEKATVEKRISRYPKHKTSSDAKHEIKRQ